MKGKSLRIANTLLLSLALTFAVIVASCHSETKKADRLRLDNKYEEATALYQKAADKGNAYAMWRLSKAYHNGDGVDYDDALALELVKQAANAGCEEAKCDLAFTYMFGWYGSGKAIEYGKKLLDQLVKTTDNSYVLSRYAMLLFRGDEPYEEDKEKAISILNDVKDKENSEYCRAMGYVYFYGTDEIVVDVQKVVEYLTKAFQKGCRDCAYLIQGIYEYGYGEIKADKVKRIEWLDKGIKSNNADCMVEMAMICLSIDTSYADYHNSPKGIDLLKRAAMHRNGEAYYNLGVLYYEGEYVKKDDIKAFENFEKASELNHPDGCGNLAWSYCNGIGCKKDINKGIEMYMKAVENGSGYAATSLYKILFSGFYGVETNSELAIYYLLKAADMGDAEGCYKLGMHYYYGSVVVEKNRSQAFVYVKKAADKGFIDACRTLAYFYEDGIGCDKDPVKAKEYRDKTVAKEDVITLNNTTVTIRQED